MSMQAAIEEALSERLPEIPELLREALLDPTFTMSITEISDRYKLSEYQEAMLEKETAFLVAGVTRPEEYLLRVAEEVDVPATTAKHLASEINLWIFTPIQEALFAFHEELAAGREIVQAEEGETAAAQEKPLDSSLPAPISDFLKSLDTEEVPQKRTMAQDVAMRQLREGATEKAETVAHARKGVDATAQKPTHVETGSMDPYLEPIE